MKSKVSRSMTVLLALALALTMTITSCTGSVQKSVSESTNSPESNIIPVATSASPIAPMEDNGFTIDRMTRPTEIPMGDKETWTIFIYMCGSDLESKYSLASFNLMQLMSNPPPENVNIIIQTGGAEQWGQSMSDKAKGLLNLEGSLPTASINPDKTQRYKVTDKLTLVDEQELSSMGKQETLYDFLSWGVEHYPAEKMGLIFWNHGGGSLNGVCLDELFDNDTLLLFEIESALNKVYEEMTDKFEFIGFDACLMSTIEVANILVPHARYMFASEETESGYGWYYPAVSQLLAEDPTLTGGQLCASLSNATYQYYELLNIENDFTLSVTDLQKVDPLLQALNDLALQMGEGFSDPTYFAELSRGINKADNYTINYMIDLGDMAKHMKDVAPDQVDALLTALGEAVVHCVNGSNHTNSTGLAIYYPMQSYKEGLLIYNFCAPTPAYGDFIHRLIQAELKLSLSRESLIQVLQPPTIDSNGVYSMQIDPTSLVYLREPKFKLFAMPEGSETCISLGNDDDIKMDWDTGIMQDNFEGQWAHLGEEPLMLNLIDSNEERNFYQSPILLNGKETNLMFSWVWDESNEDNGYYEISGTWDGLDLTTGIASRQSRDLQPGDKVVPCYSLFTPGEPGEDGSVELTQILDDGGKPINWPGNEVLIQEDTKITQSNLDPGNFLYQFGLYDVYANEISYNSILFTIHTPGVVDRKV